MKALLTFFAIILTTGFAAANNWQEVPVEKIADYKKAILSGFDQKQMKCSMVTYNEKNELIDSSDNFNFNWRLLQYDKNKIFINTNNSQPVIMLQLLAPSPLPINKDVHSWQIYLTTSDDFNSITSVDTVYFTSQTTTVHKNVGTIVNPDYKDVRVKTENRSLVNCALAETE